MYSANCNWSQTLCHWLHWIPSMDPPGFRCQRWTHRWDHQVLRYARQWGQVWRLPRWTSREELQMHWGANQRSFWSFEPQLCWYFQPRQGIGPCCCQALQRRHHCSLCIVRQRCYPVIWSRKPLGAKVQYWFNCNWQWFLKQKKWKLTINRYTNEVISSCCILFSTICIL